MGEDVPVRWFNFEKVVEALVQQKMFYLKVSQLYNIVRKKCYIEDEAEMVAMLDFYHDLGIIIWHGDTVVLQTQWLIHLFKKLITIRPFDEQVLPVYTTVVLPCSHQSLRVLSSRQNSSAATPGHL